MTKHIATIIACLLVVLLAACANRESGPSTVAPAMKETPYTLPSLAQGVEVVYYQQRGWGHPDYFDPLWGDLPEDQAAIAELLYALHTATQVKGPLAEARDATSFVGIRYTDGSLTRIAVYGSRWVILESGVVLMSARLHRWFTNLNNYMPRVEPLCTPFQVYQRQPFIVSGRGWYDSEVLELTYNPGVSERTERRLARVRLEHGSFTWEGTLPRDDPGEYMIAAEQEGVGHYGNGIVVLPSGTTTTSIPGRTCS